MKKLIQIQKKIIPEVLEVMERRYLILKQISLNEPIGRRALSSKLELSERIVRSEVEFLKNQDLINVHTSGMNISESGICLLDDLKEFIDEMMGISYLEESLREKLGIKKVIIVPGNADEDSLVIKDIGKTTCKYITKIIKNNSIIGVTGGNTMHEFADCLQESKKYENVLVVPARGGLGKEVEIQSNNIAAVVSKKLGGNYKLLHVPDNITKETLESLILEPEISKTLKHIENVNVLIFGIGRADDMARRRKMPKDEFDYILSKGAVGEAFGYYFNRNGEIVHETITIGIKLENFKSIQNTIGIVGGSRKAEAILAISKIKKDLILITDEGAANKILELI
ncbi:sugar-binding transcriptional regulator [Tepidibacter formicigenes]|jgi:central glycolytic genes regulator|uniref:Central glycolytic genes regulator n=1 Tax=Tepidibacter formicigenes DSM 15518 TaxID=1123349 RepID=A0A1M6MKP3_9FIRM|nr:sugar-binding domain-containing protein [Tepidibacter formicigenes]SHJ84029.1 central glycolytic genes regulator [Tepidibacter formicigenes DSM 15518]